MLLGSDLFRFAKNALRNLFQRNTANGNGNEWPWTSGGNGLFTLLGK